MSLKGSGSEKSKKGFMSGILLLSLSTLFVKIIGLAYKIPMMSLLGAEGMGYFNSAYEIYALLCVISTAGLPVALSMLISAADERGSCADISGIYRVGISVFLVLGAAGTLFMLALSPEISELIGNPDARASLMAIAPSLLFVCVASAVRGYFQGLCNMTPTAVSQLIEALGKLLFGAAFAYLALDRGASLPTSAAFAILGISIGCATSALYLLVARSSEERRRRVRGLSQKKRITLSSKKEKIVVKLFKIAIPITLGSALLGLTRIVDMALIMRRLQDVGYTASAASAVYGSYTTLAVPVFALIPSLITPVSLALVPRLSAAIEQGSRTSQSDIVNSSMRLTVLFAIPASMGIAVYSENILSMLFRGESEAVALAAPLLSMLAVSVLFSCIISTSNAVLQSYMKVSKPIISMAIGSAVKIVSAYILIGIPELEVSGAPISTLLCNLTVTAINLYYVNKYVPREERGEGIYLRPFLASCAMMLCSFAAYLLLLSTGADRLVAFLLSLLVALAAYAVFSLLFGAVSEADILMLPAGERIAAAIKRLGFWKKEKIK